LPIPAFSSSARSTTLTPAPVSAAARRAARLEVSTVNLIGTGSGGAGRRVGLPDRLARAIAGTTPALVLVLEGPGGCPRGRLARQGGGRRVNWFCDAHRSAEDIQPLRPPTTPYSSPTTPRWRRSIRQAIFPVHYLRRLRSVDSSTHAGQDGSRQRGVRGHATPS
jgi:hypothetical protein